MKQFYQKITDYFDLKNRSIDFKVSLKNAFYNSSETILYPLLWVISTPIFVHYLGAEQYGIWMLVNGFIGFGGGAMGLGLTDATVKFVSKYRALNDIPAIVKVSRTTMTVYCLMGILVGIVVFGFAELLVENVFRVEEGNIQLTIIALKIGGIGIVARFFNDVFRSVIYAFERHDVNAKVTMGIDIVTMVINVILVIAGFDLLAVLLSSIIFLVIGGMIKAYISKKYFINSLSFIPLYDKSVLKEVFSYSFYTWLQSILRLSQSKLDRFLIAGIISVSGLTYYVIALKVAEIIHSVLARATSFVFPMVSQLVEKGNIKRLKEIYHKATFFIVIATIAIITPTYLFGFSLLEIWMGTDFANEAILILYVFLAKYMFHPIGIINHHFLLGTGLVKLNTQFLAITVPLTLGLMLLLMPVYGLVGAALAKLVSIPSLLIMRIVSEKIVFKKLDIKSNLSYFIPAIVPFLLIIFWLINYPWLSYQIWMMIPLFLLFMLIGGGIGFFISKLCQKINLMPAFR
ncbi:oligosaccharide flippase family protein [Rhodohalobacter sp. SW132]|uniref:oligosaccharide flippase family protein n=1 Tax=Rhodohalobacter sp. SW132 TaxID=2293433 RepID=UPI001314897B|nr:oligosaccharide flippase family protein [Rhodohalobacter sp. SW132]